MKGSSQPAGLILVNLGTPENCTTASVRTFLREFLSDPRVVEVPRLIWFLILNLIVLPLRSARVAKAYRLIWTERGSPLRYHTQDQVTKLQERFALRYPDRTPRVHYAMTYGKPGLEDVLDELCAGGHGRAVILPMYPQYSGATTGAVCDQVADYTKSRRVLPALQIINSYFDQADYIAALAASVRAFWEQNGRGDRLLFSYHGIPESFVTRGDPYTGHCEFTTGAVAEALALEPHAYLMSYQSRFGKAQWVKPYTDITIRELAESGIRYLDVVCPSFATDCLETIEEIGEQNSDLFVEAGGSELRLIPCLNSSEPHIDALEAITAPYLEAAVHASRNTVP